MVANVVVVLVVVVLVAIVAIVALAVAMAARCGRLHATESAAARLSNIESPEGSLASSTLASHDLSDPPQVFWVLSVSHKYLGVDTFPGHQPGVERVNVRIRTDHIVAQPA